MFLDVDGRGDLAYVRARYVETYTIDGVPEPINDTGKVLTVLRGHEGSWRFAIWMFASDLPLPSMEGEHAEGADQS